MASFFEERVLSVHHWNETLFSFTTTRDAHFRFRDGQFVMIGLPVDGKPLLRAYSIASTSYDEHLEFYSIKVPDGPLTSRLQHLQVGDTVLVGKKPTGTLVLDNVITGRNLYLLSTGTGLAPFLGLCRIPETYEKFEKVVLLHGCRTVAELERGKELVDGIAGDEYLSEVAAGKLLYYPTVTREPFVHQGRVSDLFFTTKVQEALGLPPLDPALDRAMVCGSPEMLRTCKDTLLALGFEEGNAGEAAGFVVEKAFAESMTPAG